MMCHQAAPVLGVRHWPSSKCSQPRRWKWYPPWFGDDGIPKFRMETELKTDFFGMSKSNQLFSNPKSWFSSSNANIQGPGHQGTCTSSHCACSNRCWLNPGQKVSPGRKVCPLGPPTWGRRRCSLEPQPVWQICNVTGEETWPVSRYRKPGGSYVPKASNVGVPGYTTWRQISFGRVGF